MTRLLVGADPWSPNARHNGHKIYVVRSLEWDSEANPEHYALFECECTRDGAILRLLKSEVVEEDWP
jgi:hypothetical protein